MKMATTIQEMLVHVFGRLCMKLQCTECKKVFVTNKRPRDIPGCPSCGGELEVIGTVDANLEDVDI